MSYGFASHVGLASETTWGTAVGATDYIEAFSESLQTTIERFETKNIIGAFFQPNDVAGLNRHQGDLVFHGHPISLGHALKGAFGQNSVTTISAGALFENEFQPQQSDTSSLHPLPSYTIEAFRKGTLVNTAFQYAGVQFGGISLNYQPNQDVRATCPLIAKTLNFIAKTTPSFPGSSADPFTFDTASVSIGGTGTPRVEALTISMNNNLEGIASLNATDEIGKIRRTGGPQVSISGTFDFSDLTDVNDFINQTARQWLINVTKADSFSLLIDLPQVKFTDVPIVVPGRERLTVDFTAAGQYHSGSATNISVKLTTTNTF